MTRMTRAVAGLAAVAALTGCKEPEDHPVAVIEATAQVIGVLFLDLNGNGRADLPADEPVEDWPVQLVAPNGQVVAEARSDTAGVFRLLDVPAGRVRLELGAERLGDTLEVFGLALDETLDLGLDGADTVTIGFTYPKVDLPAIDTVPVGRRVFTEGIALTPIFTNGPREIHLRSGGEALRVIDVVRTAVSPGDSVRVLGRVRIEAGVVVLSEAQVFRISAAVGDPQPLPLTTGRAASADEGAAAADLVRIRDADLISAANVGNDVVLTVDDGTGEVEILVRSYLGSDASFFKPDSVRVREATGLLVPYLGDEGETRWRLAVRTDADLRLTLETQGAPPAPGPSAEAPDRAPLALRSRGPGSVDKARLPGIFPYPERVPVAQQDRAPVS